MNAAKRICAFVLGYIASISAYFWIENHLPVPAELAERASQLTSEMEFRDVMELFADYTVLVAKPVQADVSGCTQVLGSDLRACHLLLFAKWRPWPTAACGVYFGEDRNVVAYEFGEKGIFRRVASE